MPLLLKAALQFEGWRLSRRFDRSTAAPHHTQQRLLLNLLRCNSETVFGRKHGFVSIHSEADFRRRVPIQNYEDLLPYIRRIKLGEQMMLTADRVRRFNVTSGTTGEPKFIPVTGRGQQLAAQLMLQWLYRAWRDHSTLLDHGSLLISSPAVDGLTEGGIPFGSATGLIQRGLPSFLQRTSVLPRQVADITDYDVRYYVITRLALSRRISFIATPNPSTLLRLAQVAAHHHEMLIRSIHDGTLGDEHVPASRGHQSIIGKISSNLAPDPQRADVLSRVVEHRGRLRLGDCWPELALVACWLGGSVGYSAERLREEFDDAVPIRDLGFQASEGSFTLPCRDRTATGVLALNNQYYEFVHEADLSRAEPSVIPIHDLQQGKQYAILLTTPSGLYRYNINDIVEVDGRHHRTPTVRFVRKGRDMANITGEKIHLNHLLEAMNELRRTHAFLSPNFRVVPNIRESRYDLYVEMCNGLSPEFARDTLLPGIDRALSALNIEYGEKRRSRRLGPPRVYLMREGWEQYDRRRYAEAKGREAQYKWRFLVLASIPDDDGWISHTIDPSEPIR
jgi:hypothetical protein